MFSDANLKKNGSFLPGKIFIINCGCGQYWILSRNNVEVINAKEHNIYSNLLLLVFRVRESLGGSLI